MVNGRSEKEERLNRVIEKDPVLKFFIKTGLISDELKEHQENIRKTAIEIALNKSKTLLEIFCPEPMEVKPSPTVKKIAKVLIERKGTTEAYIKNSAETGIWLIRPNYQKVREKTAREVIAYLGLMQLNLYEMCIDSHGEGYIFPDDLKLYKAV